MVTPSEWMALFSSDRIFLFSYDPESRRNLPHEASLRRAHKTPANKGVSLRSFGSPGQTRGLLSVKIRIDGKVSLLKDRNTRKTEITSPKTLRFNQANAHSA
jgi:hypothetical protein